MRLGTDTLANARAQRLANDPDGLAGSLRGAGTGAQPSYWQDLAGIAAPVLLVVGDEDPKFRAIAMRMAAGLVRSAIEVVPGACLLYTSPSPRDQRGSRMPSSA